MKFTPLFRMKRVKDKSMAYYTVTRSIVTYERIIVKADSKMEAFYKASDDIDCDVQSDSETDYEPDYQSIALVAYVSEVTKQRIG